MKLSNYSIVLPIGELRVAENPNFTPGEMYRWTDMYAKKSYVLELRAIETVTLSECEKVVTFKPAKPEKEKPRRNKKLYETKLTLKESKAFREWVKYAKFKSQLTYQEIAEGTGVNIHSLHVYCREASRRVPVVVRTMLYSFFDNLGQKGGEA